MEGVVLSQIRLPVELHRRLKTRADAEKSSLNKTMIDLMEKGLAAEEAKEQANQAI